MAGTSAITSTSETVLRRRARGPSTRGSAVLGANRKLPGHGGCNARLGDVETVSKGRRAAYTEQDGNLASEQK